MNSKFKPTDYKFEPTDYAYPKEVREAIMCKYTSDSNYTEPEEYEFKLSDPICQLWLKEVDKALLTDTHNANNLIQAYRNELIYQKKIVEELKAALMEKPSTKTETSEDNEDCQDWLRNSIPKTWTDKVDLIPNLLFTCLINFVEEENCLDQLDMDWSEDIEKGYATQEYVDNINKLYGDLKKAYEYVKTERPQLEIDLNASYPESTFSDDWIQKDKKIVNGISFTVLKSCEERFGATYEKIYAETNRIEALIEEKDQWAMGVITKNVGYLWT